MPVPAPLLIDEPHTGAVATLGPVEPWRGQVFHAGLLWEGHVGDRRLGHRLDVHDASGSGPIASATVPHTLEHLYPFGDDAILAVGKHHDDRWGWITFHTIATFRGGRLRAATHPLPTRYQVEQFGGGPGWMWFNETGSRRVFRWTGRRAVPLDVDVRLPGTILPFAREVFVLERNSVFGGQENIVRIDVATAAIERTFPQTRSGLTSLIDLPGLPWIAVVECRADRVLLIDRAANALAAEIPVPGRPTVATVLGRCLAVHAADTRRLAFFDLHAPGFPRVADWDLAGLGDDFTNVAAVHVDPAHGTVFLRSPFHPRAPGNVPAVKSVADPSGRTLRLCGLGPAPSGRVGPTVAA